MKTVGVSWASSVGSYESPSAWYDDPSVTKEQRELRKAVFDMARWRATQLAAEQYPLRVFHHFHSRWQAAGRDKKPQIAQEWEYLRKPSGLDVPIDDTKTLRDAKAERKELVDKEGDAAGERWDNPFGIIQSIAFRILQSVGKDRLPESEWGIQPGKTDYKIEDVYCAGSNTLPCPTDVPAGLQLPVRTAAGAMTVGRSKVPKKPRKNDILIFDHGPLGGESIVERDGEVIAGPFKKWEDTVEAIRKYVEDLEEQPDVWYFTLEEKWEYMTPFVLEVATTGGPSRWMQEAAEDVHEEREEDPQHYVPTYIRSGGKVHTVLYVGSPAAIAYDVTRPHPHEGFPSLKTAIDRIVLFKNRVSRYLGEGHRQRYEEAEEIVRSLYDDQEDSPVDGGDLVESRRSALRSQIQPDVLQAIDAQQARREAREPRGKDHPTGSVGIPPLRESDVPTQPGDPGYDTLRTRMIQVLDEMVWLTAFGGRLGIIDAGVVKAMGPPGNPSYRSLSWVMREFAKRAFTLDRIGLRPTFAKRDSRTELISVVEQLLSFARTHDMPRLNALRELTFPGPEIYRRTYWEPSMAAEQGPVALQNASFFHGSQQVRVMPVKEARRIAHRVRDAVLGAFTNAVREYNRIEQQAGRPAVPENTIRHIPAGWLRWRAADDTQVSWATYLVYNTHPSIFTTPSMPLPETMMRVAAMTAATEHGWQITPGRQWLDIVADGLRVSFSDVPSFTNIGAQLLYLTGPNPYTAAMQVFAAERGFVLNSFGLFRPTGKYSADLSMVRDSIPELDTSRGDWWQQGEQLIYDVLGLHYQSPAERWAGAPLKVR